MARVKTWDIGGDRCKIHTTNKLAAKKIARWKDCFCDSVYRMPDGSVEIDIVVPIELKDKALSEIQVKT